MNLDVQSVTATEHVQAIDDALDENRHEINRLGLRREELKTEIPAAKNQLANLKADAEIGDAEDSEVEDAREHLEDLKEQRADVEERLETLGKVRDRLETKRLQAVEEEGVAVQEKLIGAAGDAMDALIDALDDAEQARQRLKEINDFARSEPDSVEVPAAASKVGKEIALVGYSNRVERSHTDLKETFGTDE